MKKLKAIRTRFVEAVESLQAQSIAGNGSWHVDICCCDDCKAYREWQDLPLWKQALALVFWPKIQVKKLG